MKHDHWGTDYLEPLKRPVNKWIGGLVCAFILSNSLLFCFLSPDHFQRAGAAWVATLLIALGAVKLVLSSLPEAARGNGVAASVYDRKFVYSDFNRMQRKNQNLGIDTSAWGIVQLPKDVDEHDLNDAGFAELFEDLKLYVEERLIAWELLLGAIATLQWGYGDLFSRLAWGIH